MYLLISTESNARFSLAIGEDKIEKIKTVENPYKQSELLLKTIDRLFEGQGLRSKGQGRVKGQGAKIKEQLKGIIVVQGPGQFSALRIGIVTANTLAHSLNIPIVGVQLKKSWLDLPEKEKLEKVWAEARKPASPDGGQGGQESKKTRKQLVIPVYGKEPNIP